MRSIEHLAEKLQDWLADEIDPPIIGKAIAIQNGGFIQKIDIASDLINARLRSERSTGKIYNVQIDTTDGNIHAECSCPAVLDCQHAAAVAMTIIQMAQYGDHANLLSGLVGTSARTDADGDYRDIPAPDPSMSPLLFRQPARRSLLKSNNVDTGQAPKQPAGLLTDNLAKLLQDHPSVQFPAADMDRWVPGFCLLRSYGTMNLPQREPWAVCRILIRRNTDGSMGRIKAWRHGYADLAYPDEAASLEDIIDTFPDEQAPAMLVGLLLTELRSTPVFISTQGDVGNAVPAHILPAGQAHLGFEPYSIENNQPLFRVVLSFFENPAGSDALPAASGSNPGAVHGAAHGAAHGGVHSDGSSDGSGAGSEPGHGNDDDHDHDDDGHDDHHHDHHDDDGHDDHHHDDGHDGHRNETRGVDREDGPRLGKPVRHNVVCPGGILYMNDATIYVARRGPLARKALAELVGISSRPLIIGHQEIQALLATLPVLLGDAISVTQPPTRVELVKVSPDLDVVLTVGDTSNAEADRIRCDFRFSYLNAELGQAGRIMRNAGDVLEIIERDPEFERAVIGFFMRLAGKAALPPDPRQPGSILLAANLRRFAQELYAPLTKAGYRFMLSSAGKPKALRKAKVVASLSSHLDWFEATMRLDVDGRGIPLDGAMVYLGGGLLSAGETLVALDDKDQALLTMLTGARHSKQDGYRLDKRDLAKLAALQEFVEDDSRHLLDETVDLYARLSGMKPSEPEPVPDGFNATLRPYQQNGFEWLLRLARHDLGALLADDMGLGKTVQALALMLRLKADGLLRPALIVAPVTVLHNWIAEIDRFSPALRPVVHHGPTRLSTAGELAAALLDRDITLTSYQTLRSDADKFTSIEWGLCLLDEAQAVKNPEAGVSKAVRSLRARTRIILTGTPVENRPLDLWSHFAFMNPGLLGTRKAFMDEYERPIAAGNNDALESLKRRTAPFILRRTKAAVLDDLPPKEEILRWIDLDPRQKGFYESLRREFAEQVGQAVAAQGIKGSAICILEALLRLRQAAIHPGLIAAEHGSHGGTKIDAAAELVSELMDEGHRVLVFSQFTSALGLLKDKLDAAGLPYEYLDGQTRDRAARIKRFQSGNGAGAFLLSLKAGGIGINLTTADYVLLLDPWWNPAVESQAVDRAHRIGQRNKVTIYRLVARGTVEEKVIQLQDRKRRLVEELVVAGADGLAGLSGQEIMDLFKP
jgi:superfamily II DNA or RNA helicase